MAAREIKVTFASLPMRQCGGWHGTGPLTAREEAFGRRFVRDILASCPNQGKIEVPLLLMRMEDVLASYWLVNRLESLLWNEGVMLEKPGDMAKPASAHPALEAAGKARERLRKALGELEEVLGRSVQPAQAVGIADLFRPLLMNAEGIYEASLGGSNAEADHDATE